MIRCIKVKDVLSKWDLKFNILNAERVCLTTELFGIYKC